MSSQVAVIRATLKYSSQEELIKGMTPLISRSGLFIHTRTTRPTGSEVHFEFQLADGSQTYSGEGIVRKEIPFTGGDSAHKSGMLIALRRINRAFKEVVDEILSHKGDDSEDESDSRPKRQKIVEARAGSSKGIDVFGDMDLDAGLDSLFAGIEKKPSAGVGHGVSGMFERPTVVSGVFQMPAMDDDELELEYDENDGIGFDTEGIGDVVEEALASDEAGYQEFDMRARSNLIVNADEDELKKRTTAKTGQFEPIESPEVIRRTAAKTGEFEKEANEVLAAERENVRIHANVGALSSLSGARISPVVQQSPTTAVTGRFSVSEELARAERERMSQGDARGSVRDSRVGLGSADVLSALAETQHEVYNTDALDAAMSEVKSILKEDDSDSVGGRSESVGIPLNAAEGLDKDSAVFHEPTPERAHSYEALFPKTDADESPSELFEALQHAFLGAEDESGSSSEAQNAAEAQAEEGSEPAVAQESATSDANVVSEPEQTSDPDDDDVVISEEDLASAGGAAETDNSVDSLLSQELDGERSSAHRRERPSGIEAPVEKKGFFRSLFGK